MFPAMPHALGMEPLINPGPDQPSKLNDSGSNRPAQWHSNKCTRHPIVPGSATAGMARKTGHCQVVANLAKAIIKPAECLRLVIETRIHDEQGHQISLDTHTHISDDACERMGDVLEAAGGMIDPWTPAAKPFMMATHGPHGIDATNDADAFRSLSGLAQGIKELAGMRPLPKAPDGSKDSNRARIWTILKELRPDELTLTTTRHKGCWICNELTRVGGARLLNEDEEGQATHDEPTRIYSVKKYVRVGKGRMLIEPGAHLKPRRAWTRDTSHEQRTVSKQHPPTDSGHHLGHMAERHPEQRNTCVTIAKRCSTDRSRASSRGRPGTCHTRNSPRDGSTGLWTQAGSASAACWSEKLNIRPIGRTRDALELPPASQPAAVVDNRFHQHAERWSICGKCDCYCTGRARDWLPGSFVYCTDNTPAGPPKSWKGCFTSSMTESHSGETARGMRSSCAGLA